MIHSQDLTRVLNYSKEVAESRDFKEIDQDVLFNALVCHSNLAVSSIFGFFDYDIEDVFTISEINLAEKKTGKRKEPSYSKGVKRVLEDSLAVAEYYEQDDIRPEMLLLALSSTQKPPFVLERIFEEIQREEFISKIVEFINDIGDFNFCETLEGESLEKDESDMFVENKILDQFATNLNVKAKNGDFDNLIEYDDTIQKLATILCKKTKPNAILVGASGAGKTSAIEMLARQIVSGNAPELLSNKVIYNVNLSSMVAGTQFRGQFEERLQKFVEEAKKYDNIILFIDEIHTLIGAGGTGTGKELEASNMLKPALARGDISCIGATTAYEYNLTIKKDAALDRRFEKVFVTPPSSFQMEGILPELIGYYSRFHAAEYDESFCGNLLSFCDKYMPNRSYPDKAVDVIDHCGAMAKMAFYKLPNEIKELKNELKKDLVKDLSSVQDVFGIEEKLTKLRDDYQIWEKTQSEKKIVIDESHLRNFFKTRLNVFTNLESISQIGNYLKNHCLGKDKEINLLSKGLAQESLKRKSSPTSILLYGDKGRGRTFIARKIAESARIFGAQVFEFNGVEFDDRRKILGDRFEADSLAQKVAMLPNGVVVIDDFDKTKSNVTPVFEQILKEGRLTLEGEVIDFSNIVFVFLSGVASDSKVGFGGKGSNNPKIDLELKKLISIQIELPPIEKDNLKKIVEEKIKDLQVNLVEKTEIDPLIVDEIIDQAQTKEDKFLFIEEEINKKILPDLVEV